MKTRFYGILILVLLVVPVITTYSYLHIKKQNVRKQVKQKILNSLDKEELVLLTFSDIELKQLKWKHSREFEYKGQMFDVVTKEIKGKRTIFHCWVDNEETKLNKQIDELMAFVLGNNKESKNAQKRLNDYFNSLFFSEIPTHDFLSFQSNIKFNIYNISNKLISITPSSPPPQIA